MASWSESAAIAQFRSIVGDGVSDHFVYKTKPYPSPDGLTKQFFAGHHRIVSSTLSIFLQGASLAVSGTPDYTGGYFTVTTAPSPSGNFQASYYYQWFTDTEIVSFLTSAANALRFDTVDDSGIAIGLRPALVTMAASDAFYRKAAEYSNAISAQGGGFSVDKTHASPNWKGLGEAFFKKSQDLIELYVKDPLNQRTPEMRFVTIKLLEYLPRT